MSSYYKSLLNENTLDIDISNFSITGLTANSILGVDSNNLLQSITLGGNLSYNSNVLALANLTGFTTDNLTEGKTNLYYTDAHARAALSAGAGIGYNSSSGVISNIGTGANVSLYFNYSVVAPSPNTIGYKQAGTAPSMAAASSITTPITSADGNKLIVGFLTDSNYPNQTFTPAGEWMIDFYASKSSNSPTINFYFTVSSFNNTTQAETLLITSGTVEITSLTIANYHMSATMGTYALNATDRILIKLYCNSDKSASYNLITYYEDNTQVSHIHTSLSFVSTIQGLVLGTTNQINVANVDYSKVQLSLPQSINTTATPTFGGLTLGSLSGVLKASAGVISGGATTTNLSEGTNKYYTDSRVITLMGTLSADYLPNGTYNKYFTNSLARLAQNAGTGISYDYSTGTITNTAPAISYSAGLNISLAGSAIATIASPTFTNEYITGSLGIGTTTPNAQLHVQSSTYGTPSAIGDFRLIVSGSLTNSYNAGIGCDSADIMWMNAKGGIRNYISGSLMMELTPYVLSIGNYGSFAIGPNNSYYTDITQNLYWGGSPATWRNSTAGGCSLIRPSGGTASNSSIQLLMGDSTTAFPAGAAQTMGGIIMTMDGVNPLVTLTHGNWIAGTYMSLQFQQNNSFIKKDYNNGMIINDNNQILIQKGGTTIATVNSTGVGIGRAPGWKFHVDTTTAWDGIVLTNNGSNRSYIVNDSVNGSQFVLADNGNKVVDINTGGDCILGTTAAMGCTYRKHQAFTPSGTVGTYKWTRIPISYQNEGGLPIHISITRNITENPVGGMGYPYGGPSCEIKAMCRYWHIGMMSAVVQYDYHGAAGAEITNVAPYDNASNGCFIYVRLSGGCTYHLWTHVDSGTVGTWEDSAVYAPATSTSNAIYLGLNVVGGGGYATTPAFNVAGDIMANGLKNIGYFCGGTMASSTTTTQALTGSNSTLTIWGTPFQVQNMTYSSSGWTVIVDGYYNFTCAITAAGTSQCQLWLQLIAGGTVQALTGMCEIYTGANWNQCVINGNIWLAAGSTVYIQAAVGINQTITIQDRSFHIARIGS